MKKFFKGIAALLMSAVMVASTSVLVSADETPTTISLSNATTIGGELVAVDMALNSNDTCSGFNMDIAFDSNLELVDVQGAMAYEVNGNVVTIVGFTGLTFTDDEPIVTMIFRVIDTAKKGEHFNVNVATVNDMASVNGEVAVTNIITDDSTVEVIDTKENLDKYTVVTENKTTEYVLLGDVDNNGRVDLIDAIMAAQELVYGSKLNARQRVAADINVNNTVDLQDVIEITKSLL